MIKICHVKKQIVISTCPRILCATLFLIVQILIPSIGFSSAAVAQKQQGARASAAQAQQQIQQQAYQQAAQSAVQPLPEWSDIPPYPGDSNTTTKSGSTAPTQVLSLAQIWQELEYSSEIWPMIMDAKAKEITVARQIDMFKEEGFFIQKEPLHYVDMIDNMIIENKELLNNRFKDLLRVLAVMEYDFDNGQIDKDKLARQVLGEKAYEENKRRAGR